MSASVLVGYLLAGFGVATVVVAGWRHRAIHVDRKVGNAVLRKNLEHGNINRARKLCYAARGSYFDAVREAIEAGLASSSTDQGTLEAVTSGAFEAAAKKLAVSWRALSDLGFAGVLMLLAAPAVAQFEGDLPLVLVIAAGLGVLVAAWLLTTRRAMQHSIVLARTEILPAIVKAIIAGPPEPPTPPPPQTEQTDPFRIPGPPSEHPPAPPSLRDGKCPQCGHLTIRRVENLTDPRFYRLVCLGCGFAQEMAELSKLDV